MKLIAVSGKTAACHMQCSTALSQVWNGTSVNFETLKIC